MATMNISLPDKMKKWVEEQVNTGRYANTSDFVRDVLREKQDYHEKLMRLQAEIQKGYDSGPSHETLDDIWDKIKSKYNA